MQRNQHEIVTLASASVFVGEGSCSAPTNERIFMASIVRAEVIERVSSTPVLKTTEYENWTRSVIN